MAHINNLNKYKMKTIKIFSVCCGMLLAGIVSTTKSYADETLRKVRGSRVIVPLSILFAV